MVWPFFVRRKDGPPQKRLRNFLLALLALLLSAAVVRADAPVASYVFPAGGQRGTTVKVRVGGECLPPGMAFKLTGSGVTAPGVLGAEVKMNTGAFISRAGGTCSARFQTRA